MYIQTPICLNIFNIFTPFMKKLAGIILLSCSISLLSAQTFYIDYPKTKDAFTYDLIRILNDAPSKFLHLKGKLLGKTDTIHLQSQIFQLKSMLEGATAGRYVQDSTFYVEYFFGQYQTVEEAMQAQKILTSKIAKALNSKVVILTNNWGNDNNTVIEKKIAYCMHNGFFHYNMVVQVNKVIKNNSYRLVFQVYYGRPDYYYWIMKNEPIGSFNLTLGIRNTMASFNTIYTDGCPTDIAAFTCKGKYYRNDTTFVDYYKTGFAGLLNARSEYDAVFGNIRAGLGSDYVYFTINTQSPVLRKVAFVKFEDIDKPKRKTIFLSLNETSNTNSITPPPEKEYEMDLTFAY